MKPTRRGDGGISGQGPDPDDPPPTLSQAWLTEVKLRSQEIDAGAVTTESWEAVRRRLFEKHITSS